MSTNHGGYYEDDAKVAARMARRKAEHERIVAQKQAEQSAQQNNTLIRAVAVSEG